MSPDFQLQFIDILGNDERGVSIFRVIGTQDGSAPLANNDYIANSRTGQTIAAGSSIYMFDVTVNGDTTVEPDETFKVIASGVSGATVSVGQGTGTIRNDDSATPGFNFTDFFQPVDNS